MATVTIFGENDAPPWLWTRSAAMRTVSGKTWTRTLARSCSISGLDDGEFRTLNGQFGTLKLFADGSYTYLADRSNDLILGECGSDSFTYQISDGDGATATGSLTMGLMVWTPPAALVCQSRGVAAHSRRRP